MLAYVDEGHDDTFDGRLIDTFTDTVAEHRTRFDRKRSELVVQTDEYVPGVI